MIFPDAKIRTILFLYSSPQNRIQPAKHRLYESVFPVQLHSAVISETAPVCFRTVSIPSEYRDSFSSRSAGRLF